LTAGGTGDVGGRTDVRFFVVIEAGAVERAHVIEAREAAVPVLSYVVSSGPAAG